VLEANGAHVAEESERWLDTWFTPPAQERLRAAVARLSGTKAAR
jgi:hypothetical protein